MTASSTGDGGRATYPRAHLRTLPTVTDPSPDEHPEPIVVATYSTTGEAEVAEAKLRAFGIEAALDDQIEGGTVPVDDEPVVVVRVRAMDADDARQILTDTDAPADGS
jgi:hypothetical protein